MCDYCVFVDIDGLGVLVVVLCIDLIRCGGYDGIIYVGCVGLWNRLVVGCIF